MKSAERRPASLRGLFFSTAVAFLFVAGLALRAYPSPVPDRLEEVLAAMKAAGDRLRTLSCRFEQTNHDYILDEDDHSSGSLYADLPGRILWEYDPPQRKVLLVKDDKIQLYTPASNQLQVFDRGQMRGAGADLLIGFGKSNAELGENYDVRLLEETESTAVLELVPKPGSSASVFRSIELTMDKERWIPLRSVFHEPNRDTSDIHFLDVKVNGKLPPGVFDLKLPPDVEIIGDR